MRGNTNGAVAKADCENDSIGFNASTILCPALSTVASTAEVTSFDLSCSASTTFPAFFIAFGERHVLLWRPGLGKIEIENYHAGAGSVECFDQARMQGARPAIRIIRELEAFRRFAVDSDDDRVVWSFCGAS